MIPVHRLFQSNTRGQRGFILITSYMLLSAMSISSFALFSRASSFRQANERTINKTVAFNMAESALDVAIAQIELDGTYTGTNGYVPLNTAATQQGGYQVTVSTPEENPNVRQITAIGYAPSNVPTSTAYETRTVTAFVEIQTSSLFDFAVFAENNIQMSGNAMVDSYDSRNGEYGGDNVGENGDVGTNSTETAGVHLSGNVQVVGDVEIGPGGDTGDVIDLSSNAEITGTQSASESPRIFDVVTSDEISLGDLTINGNSTVDIPAGTYRYDSFSISGNGQLNALGPITLYVDGRVTISGNGVSTQSNLPTNFIIYQTTGERVHFSGNANFYGAVYAPDSEIQNTGNGEVYGALVSQEYHQSGNGKVHYDEALNEIGGQSNDGVGMLSWVEENTTAWNH